MKEKPRKILGSVFAALLLLLVIAPLCLYALLRLGWPPVIGNLSAAGKLKTYAAQVYPDAEPEGFWAGYNLVDGCYSLNFLGPSGESHSLRYNAGTALVRDYRREEALRGTLEIDKALRMNGLQRAGIYWWVSWDYREPETPLVTIRQDFRDPETAPVPDEAAIREKLADRAMELYEVLSPVTLVYKVSVYYGHDALRPDARLLWYWISVELPEDTPLTREMVLSGKLMDDS